ncbi:MAG TPA: hypothetical protein PKO45_01565 [Rubrivivax sp.]|nr:hypothetical protein [Burkholderiales bacterium]HNT37782.1 hypothetical protein [Rubrivivax sp.]
MFTSAEEMQALQRVAELDPPLTALEESLAALGQALCSNDAAAIEQQASELHCTLARAVTQFAHAARAGSVPPVLRRRLALAGGRVAAQREALARATASLDRAIDVLLPPEPGGNGLYGAAGHGRRPSASGSLQA